MKFKIINKENQKGTQLHTFGSAVYIPSLLLKVLVAIYAVLPLFSAWAFAIVPKIKGVWIRW